MTHEIKYIIEESGINQDRIVNDKYNLINELFCAICQGVLWKPRSCSSCQHLFCNQCIRTWLQFNPTSCPYRCSPYEEKRAPPHIHSLLGRLSIRCRNSLFGCTEILSYNLLEQHENFECQFPTKQCNTCRKYILINEMDLHEISCIPEEIQCSICKCLVNQTIYQEHMKKCLQEKFNHLIDQMLPLPDTVEIPTNNNTITFPQTNDNQPWFIQFNNRLQQHIAATGTVNLIGFEAVVRSREENYFTRIWTVLRLIIFNKLRAFHILFFLLCGGIGNILGCLLCFCLFIQEQVSIAMYRSFVSIILFSGLFCFGLPVLFASISDTLIILFTVISLTLWSSTNSDLPLQYFRLNAPPKVVLFLYIFVLFSFKFSLLVTRFYLSCIPSYISAGCLAWITIFLTFYTRHF